MVDVSEGNIRLAAVADEWLSTGEVARLLGVHRTTVVDYINRGLLPARRLPTGRFRVRREDALKLLRAVDDDLEPS